LEMVCVCVCKCVCVYLEMEGAIAGGRRCLTVSV
jgi:hypothetical protein